MLAVHSNINETCFRLLLSDVLYIFNAVSELSKKHTHTQKPIKTSCSSRMPPQICADTSSSRVPAFQICTEFPPWSSQSREMGPVTGQDKADGTAAVD